MATDDYLTPDSQPHHAEEPAPARILIVDDEEAARALSEGALSTVKGYEVQAEASTSKARQIARQWRPDVIILDITMPEMNGIALAALLRADGCDAELMFLTGDDKIDTKEEGLEIANQYLTKPYNTRELLAVVRVMLRTRRQQGAHARARYTPAHPEIDALRPVFDETSDLVRIPRGRDARLTGVTRMLLLALLAGEGKPVSKRKLYEAVWMSGSTTESRATLKPGEKNLVEVSINRLRTKIEIDSTQPELIITARGGGYFYNLMP